MMKFRDDRRDYTDVVAYFITYHTYGTWLHGDERGSVDDEHNAPGTAVLPGDPKRKKAASRQMTHWTVELDEARRAVVERTIREVAAQRGWTLHALNVRTNHVHVVVTANAPPEKVMNDFKAWSTRRMVEGGLFEQGHKVWGHHGSTKYLWDETSLEDACRYVVEGQGVDLGQAELRSKTEPQP